MRLYIVGALSVLLGIFLLQAVSSAEKSGLCPYVGGPNTIMLFKCPPVNDTVCKKDEDCGGDQKCCSEYCINRCRDPVFVVA